MNNPCDSCLVGWCHCDKNGCVTCECNEHKEYVKKLSDDIIESLVYNDVNRS